MSRRSQQNTAFLNAASGGGRQPGDVVSTSKWGHHNASTQGTTTRFRSGSITETHYHGGGTSLGTATHTNRNNVTTSIAKSQMNASTKSFAWGRY